MEHIHIFVFYIDFDNQGWHSFLSHLTMDVFDYRAAKKVNTDGVFQMYQEGDLSGLFVRLKNLTIAEIHTQWDVAFLETYIKLSMVPRSLRWQVSPQKGDLDLQEWFRYFNDAGVNFLEFLVTRKNTKLTKLDNEIKTLKETMSSHKESDEYKDRSSNLLKILDREEKEQKIKKKKKYNRDFSDYQSSLVFEWQKKLAAEEQSESNSRMEAIMQGEETPITRVTLPQTPRVNKDQGKTPKKKKIAKKVNKTPHILPNKTTGTFPNNYHQEHNSGWVKPSHGKYVGNTGRNGSTYYQGNITIIVTPQGEKEAMQDMVLKATTMAPTREVQVTMVFVTIQVEVETTMMMTVILM